MLTKAFQCQQQSGSIFFKETQKQELSRWQRQRGRPTQTNRKWAQHLCAWHHPPENVRHLTNGDSTRRLSHSRNFSVRPSPFGAASCHSFCNSSGSFVHMALTVASCNDTSECNIRSCARLAHLKPRRALARHLERRMREFRHRVQPDNLRHCPWRQSPPLKRRP